MFDCWLKANDSVQRWIELNSEVSFQCFPVINMILLLHILELFIKTSTCIGCFAIANHLKFEAWKREQGDRAREDLRRRHDMAISLLSAYRKWETQVFKDNKAWVQETNAQHGRITPVLWNKLVEIIKLRNAFLETLR